MNPGYRLNPNVPAFFWNAGTSQWEVKPRLPRGVAEQAEYSGFIRIPKDHDDPTGPSIPCSVFVVPGNPDHPIPPYLGNSQWAQRSPLKPPDPSDSEEGSKEPELIDDPVEQQVQTASLKRIARKIAF